MNINDVKWLPCGKDFRAQVGMVVKCDQGGIYMIGDATALTWSDLNHILEGGCGCCSCEIDKLVQWAWAMEGLITYHRIEIQKNGERKGEIEVPYNCNVDTALEVLQDDSYYSQKYNRAQAKKVIFVSNKLINFIFTDKEK
jgi:hypothetical protein